MTMRLSEAIRLGALLRPQGFDFYEDKHDGTCTLGAALDAIGCLEFTKRETLSWASLWPWLSNPPSRPCPACEGYLSEPAACVIVHLNDDHRWTREAIADWVATIEPQEEQSGHPAVELEAVR